MFKRIVKLQIWDTELISKDCASVFTNKYEITIEHPCYYELQYDSLPVWILINSLTLFTRFEHVLDTLIFWIYWYVIILQSSGIIRIRVWCSGILWMMICIFKLKTAQYLHMLLTVGSLGMRMTLPCSVVGRGSLDSPRMWRWRMRLGNPVQDRPCLWQDSLVWAFLRLKLNMENIYLTRWNEMNGVAGHNSAL